MDYLLYVLIPLVAFLYASVGHGGASGYLALMALFGVPSSVMKPNALLLNILISAISFYHFRKAGYFKWPLFLVFAIGSIPAAFVGGIIDVDPLIYKIILALFLLLSIAKFLGLNVLNERVHVTFSWSLGISIGVIIGFLSGLIGIGGGIILSPLIVFLNWGNLKEAAAVSALFIWVNSVSGMAGQLYSGISLSTDIWIWAILAVLGGYFGALFGSKRFNNQVLRYILAFVLSLACIKLLIT